MWHVHFCLAQYLCSSSMLLHVINSSLTLKTSIAPHVQSKGLRPWRSIKDLPLFISLALCPVTLVLCVPAVALVPWPLLAISHLWALVYPILFVWIPYFNLVKSYLSFKIQVSQPLWSFLCSFNVCYSLLCYCVTFCIILLIELFMKQWDYLNRGLTPTIGWRYFEGIYVSVLNNCVLCVE